MKIVADGSITYAKEAFGSMGEVRILRGREITPEDVKDADVLLVRSITPVNAELLEGSRVRFVATATIGTDHIDQKYLQDKGIGFSSAPGTNADAVAEYVLAALLEVSKVQGRQLSGSSMAVIGVGNVGSRVAARGEALGMDVSRNDPPLRRESDNDIYKFLDEVIGCDIVTLHVPLTRGGEDPTFHLLNKKILGKMSKGALLINTSRGAVVDGGALLEAINRGRVSAVLDVWEKEPNIDTGLLAKVELGTPHIAGYSFEGKVNGTVAIYRAACKFLGVQPSWDPTPLIPEAELTKVEIDCSGKAEEDIIREAILSMYNIRCDDEVLREIADLPKAEQGGYFEKLRREYPRRREFSNTYVELKGSKETVTKKLEALGLKIKS